MELPPLRDRKGDVPLLAGYFLERFGREGSGIQGISREAMELLEAYPWPGNVRQLQNVLRRSMALGAGEVLRSDDLPDEVRGSGGGDAAALAGTFAPARERHLAAFERAYLVAALRDSLGDVTRAVGASGIPRATFYRLLKKHGVDPERFRAS